MDEDSALVLFRAARDADPTLLAAHLEYVNSVLGYYGNRRRLQTEYRVLASGGDPFFACLALVIQHWGNPDGEAAALARLDSVYTATGCSAVRRLALLGERPRTPSNVSEFEDSWRRALRYAPDVPDILVYRARWLGQAARWEEARAVLREAIQRVRHPVNRVYSYLELAGLEREAGYLARSDEIRRAVEDAVQRDGRRGLEFAYLLAVPAAFWSGSGGPQLRDSVVFRHVRLALRYGQWGHRLGILSRVARHLLDQHGDPSAALPYLDHMVALADSVGRPGAQLQAYRVRGRIYYKMGRLLEAQRDLLRAVAFGRLAEWPYELGEAYHNLAHTYESAGRLEDASRMADRWIETVDAMRSSPARMMAYHDAGIIRWKAGWHAAATEAFAKMVFAIEELGSGYYWAGEYFERVGDFARALWYYRLGVQDQPALTATVGLAGLARMYEALGFPDSAEAAAREHDGRLDTPWAVPLLPRLLLRQGRREEAIAIARAWAEQRVSRGNIQGGTLSLLELSELLLEQREPGEAVLQAQRAAEMARQLNLTDELIRARRLLGAARVQLGNTAGGLAALREAAALARSHPTTDAVRETHLALGDALAGGNRVAEALDAYDRAAQAVEQVAGHLVEDLDRARYRARQLAPFDGALRVLLRQPGSQERSRALLRWSQRRKAAALALAVASGTSGSVHGPVSLETLQRRLGTGEALLDYVLVDGSAAAIVVTQAGIHVKPLGVPVDSLRWWTDELTWPLRARAGGQVDIARLVFDVASARRLYQALLGPLEPWLASKTRLTIVPDGILHYLPFEALMLPARADHSTGAQESSAYVLDRYEIVYRPSSQFLAASDAPGGRGLRAGGRVLVLAHAVPGEQGEVEAIRGAWGAHRVSVLAGSAASETAAKHASAAYAAQHFAVHAVADNQDPLKSHLRLAADSGNDGYLHLSEIVANRTAAKLVVLSACESLSGRLYEGEGLMGLARAFLVSGGREVVATRWPVGAPTAELMRVFYARLASGAPVATALRDGKLALRNNPSMAHPFFWAGFALLSTQ